MSSFDPLNFLSDYINGATDRKTKDYKKISEEITRLNPFGGTALGEALADGFLNLSDQADNEVKNLLGLFQQTQENSLDRAERQDDRNWNRSWETKERANELKKWNQQDALFNRDYSWATEDRDWEKKLKKWQQEDRLYNISQRNKSNTGGGMNGFSISNPWSLAGSGGGFLNAAGSGDLIDKGSAGMMAAGVGSRSGSHSDTDWSDFYNLRGNLAQMKAINRLLSDPENTDFLNSLAGGSGIFSGSGSGLSGSGSAAGLAGFGY